MNPSFSVLFSPLSLRLALDVSHASFSQFFFFFFCQSFFVFLSTFIIDLSLVCLIVSLAFILSLPPSFSLFSTHQSIYLSICLPTSIQQYITPSLYPVFHHQFPLPLSHFTHFFFLFLFYRNHKLTNNPARKHLSNRQGNRVKEGEIG